MSKVVGEILRKIKIKDSHEKEFIQAVTEVLTSITPLLEKDPKKFTNVLQRIVEPERVISFRVPWMNDKNELEVNRGFRVQFNSALGPYKGGLRFHPSVNLSIIKFLGFEQCLKNALTGLPMGGGKGGSDFDPRGKSDEEVMKFCQSFMTELQRSIGQDTDVPAGDIGVGGREIGYLFGQYKRIRNEFTGTLTGKGYSYGGSLLRPEATGYGLVYFTNEMLNVKKDNLKGKHVLVSGSGNVAQYCVEKLIHEGAIALTMSDSDGYIYAEKGITPELLDEILDLKNRRRGRLSELKSTKFSNDIRYVAGEKPWGEKAYIALPCATQNEIDEKDANDLVKGGVKWVVEGANMPSTAEAIEIYFKNGVTYGPAKASNAGGVATSGLEMSQNSLRLRWTREEVDERLRKIMKTIHKNSYEAAERYGLKGNYQFGANAAGFLLIADAMECQGYV